MQVNNLFIRACLTILFTTVAMSDTYKWIDRLNELSTEIFMLVSGICSASGITHCDFDEQDDYVVQLKRCEDENKRKRITQNLIKESWN
jgi:hypothetical protein